jgi:hypothetical protein
MILRENYRFSGNILRKRIAQKTPVFNTSKKDTGCLYAIVN